MQRHDLRQRTPDVEGENPSRPKSRKNEAPKQNHLGVFEKQQEGSCRCMATAFFSSLKEDVEVALKSATRKTPCVCI